MQYDKAILSIRDDVESFSVKQSIDINVLFLSQITKYISDDCYLLDLGTGNGFVLSQIFEKINKHVRLFGVDNSHETVLLAREKLTNKATIIESDIGDMPFKKGSFNIVVAKNVTRINPPEIFRVLKDDGIFVFREYGLGKGMVEIAELFDGRIIRQRKPEFYVEKLIRAGFNIVNFDKFEIKRSYDSAEQLVSIVKSFPFIKDFSETDYSVILKRFAENATITSDPFILVAIKKKKKG